MGIQRWGKDGIDYWMSEADDGRYVRFADHEQVVADYDKAVNASHKVIVEKLEEIDRLRAELAAKSKDAERYRWLQMQSPYRFKKIQDACVIDSVDVLYFKADRFNELLDAAMGDGNGR